jgi:hypothetical protein
MSLSILEHTTLDATLRNYTSSDWVNEIACVGLLLVGNLNETVVPSTHCLLLRPCIACGLR